MDFWSEQDVPLSEFVEYHLYSISRTTPLQGVLGSIKQACDELCLDYFWHRQEPLFVLKDRPTLPHIHGKFETGDSVEDEWMMVYVLMQLTRLFPDIVATVRDADGEFLLIETAEVLPKWLDKVDASINRVFIKEGKVVIIPKCIKVASMTDALNNISTTENYPLIQEQVETRAIEAHEQPKHHARLALPEKAWRMIHMDPSLSSKAVDALYGGDSELQYKAQASNILPPKDMIQTTVKFSRSAFAQLACQPFEPLPVSEWSKAPRGTSSEGLGMRLVCGLEMLCTSLDVAIPEVPVPPNEQPEDALEWMELDESTFEEDFLKSNPVDRIAEKFERSMGTFDSDESGTDASEDSFLMENLSDIDASDEDDRSEDDTFLEREILEAIKNDPDLLMKIVEKSGLDPDSSEYADLFERLRLTECTAKQKGSRQKGLADLSAESKTEIEEYKRRIEESRRKRAEPENEEVDNEPICKESSSEEETEIYSPSFKDIYSKYKHAEVAPSDSE